MPSYRIGCSEALRAQLVLCALAISTMLLSPARGHAEVVPLRALEQMVLHNDTRFEGHEARVRGAEAEIRRSASAYYPQVGLRAEVNIAPGRNLVSVRDAECLEDKASKNEDPNGCTPYRVSGARALDQGAAAFKPYERAQLDITATGPLYDFGRTKAAVQAAHFMRSALLAEREAEQEAAVRAVRAAYLEWLNRHELARIAEDAARDAEGRLARVGGLIEQGERPKVALVPAQTDALLTKLELSRAHGNLQTAQLALEEAVGAPLPSAAEPDLALLESQESLTPLASSPDAVLHVLDRHRAASFALEGAYKKQRRPEFGLSLTAGMRQQQSSIFPAYAGGLYLSMPFWDGGLAVALSASARAQADGFDAQLKLHNIRQENAHKRAAHEAQQALDSLVIAEDLVSLAQKRLVDAQDSFELGVGSIDQIAQARTVLRRAQTEVLFSRVTQAEVRLRFAPIEGRRTAPPGARDERAQVPGSAP